MVKRKIILIDEDKCNGCGLCIPDCPEGALQLIDGKARLISDLYCDGLGACIGSCPKGAINIIEREAEPYDEIKVMKNIVKQGANVIKAHLEHLKAHKEEKYLKEAVGYLKKENIENPIELENKQESHACPGSKSMEFKGKQESELRQWPIQLMLVPPNAPYFDNADLLIAADCVPFAYANFHQEFLKNKSLIIGCPKLDDIEFYKEKLIEIIKTNNIKNITSLHMEVPCCFGLQHAIEEAIKVAGKDIKLKEIIITLDGEKKQ